MSLFLLIVAIVLLAVSALILRRVTSSAGPRYYAVMLLLRAVALLVLAVLIWNIFWGPEELVVKASRQNVASEVIVLQDRSLSMELLGGPARKREELAEAIWSDVERRAEELKGKGRFRLKRYLFAEKLVDAGSGGSLSRTRSALSKAFTALLSREAVSALLLVSDGATTDGLAPPYFVDWARNRNVRIHAVCSAIPDWELVDRAIQAVVCEKKNPSTVTAKVSSVGKETSPLTITLLIDGSRSAQVHRDPVESDEIVFRLPPLQRGWHEYCVEIEPVDGEATELNNRFYGVFRLDREDRILFLHDTPRVEHVHLANFMRSKLEKGCVTLPASKLPSEEMENQTYGYAPLVILAGVGPDKIPETLRTAWLSGKTRLLCLGDAVGSWSREIPAYPIADVQSMKFLGGAGRPGGSVEVSAEAAAEKAFRETKLELQLDLVYEASLRHGARSIFAARADGELLPLLVTDSVLAPKFVVLLTDTTWKWARHREGSVRRDYESFWSACLEWLGDRGPQESPILLELETADEIEEEIRGWVRASPDHEGTPLLDCRVVVHAGGQKVEVSTEWSERHRFRYRWQRPDPTTPASGIVWLQAFASLNGKDVASERVAVAFNRDLEELSRVEPEPGVLEQYTTGEGESFAWFPGRSAVIDALLRTEAAPIRTTLARRRAPFWEFSLALLVFLCLGVEWWFERRLRRKRKP